MKMLILFTIFYTAFKSIESQACKFFIRATIFFYHILNRARKNFPTWIHIILWAYSIQKYWKCPNNSPKHLTNQLILQADINNK